jgi:rhodanese-related sulfurtransferase
MNVPQIIVYGVLALFLVAYIRKFRLGRSVAQYSPAEVADKLRTTGTVVLLDVRTERERQGHSIKGSLHIPIQSLAARAGELEGYRQKEIICYCQTGNRSLAAAVRLKRLGFNAASMKGGIAEWNFSQMAH